MAQASQLVPNHFTNLRIFLSGKIPEQNHITISVSFPLGEGLKVGLYLLLFWGKTKDGLPAYGWELVTTM